MHAKVAVMTTLEPTPTGPATPDVRFLDLPDGRLAYDDVGQGRLIIATPAMLDLRSELRYLVPRLVNAGFRVVTIDQRGMGDTSARWPAYGSTPMAADLIALIEHLDSGPAIIYGTSNGAAAGVYVAAERPDLVSGLILAAPFVRDGKGSWLQRQLMKIMRIPFLTLPIYLSYYAKWEPRKPRVADFDDHVARLRANFNDPARRHVINAYIFEQTHREAEARLERVSAPVLVIMGTADVDWPDPVAEADWIASRLTADVLMLHGAGHHPHVEYPEAVADAVIAFIAKHIG